MTDCKLISVKELKKGNKRLCLSALRVFGKCDECEVMKKYYQDQTKTKGVKPCESAVFSKERLEYLDKKTKLKKQIQELNTKLNKLKGG